MTEAEKIILQSQRATLLGLSVLLSISGQENRSIDPMTRMQKPAMHPLLSATQDQLQAAMINITQALDDEKYAGAIRRLTNAQ